MATQLAERPSRLERVNDSESETINKSERVSLGGAGNNSSISKINDVKNVAKNVFKKPITLNFIAMIVVALALDFLSTIPALSILVSISYNIIFIPWFMFSGVKFNMKKIGSMGATSILEYIPFISFLPLLTANVIYSYYSK